MFTLHILNVLVSVFIIFDFASTKNGCVSAVDKETNPCIMTKTVYTLPDLGWFGEAEKTRFYRIYSFNLGL